MKHIPNLMTPKVVWACPWCMPDVFTLTKKRMKKQACSQRVRNGAYYDSCEGCKGPAKYVLVEGEK